MAKVEIYSSPWCGYCMRAKRLLDAKGVAYEDIDIDADSARRNEMASRAGGRRTVPQIFIGEQAIGGYTDLVDLDKRGQLDPMLRG